jgi:hypothetical protein
MGGLNRHKAVKARCAGERGMEHGRSQAKAAASFHQLSPIHQRFLSAD